MENEKVSLKRYAKLFSLYYIGTLILVNVAMIFLGLNLGVIANIAVLVAASFGTSLHFIDDNKRVPTKEEKRTLCIQGLIISLLISNFLTVLALGTDNIAAMISKTGPVVLLIIILIICLLHFALLNYSYGKAAVQLAQKRLKNEM